MRAPKTVYYVDANGGKRRAYQKGGGLLTQLKAAEQRCGDAKKRGAKVKLYKGTVIWEEIPTEELAQRIF